MKWWQKFLCTLGDHKPVESTFLRAPIIECAWCERVL